MQKKTPSKSQKKQDYLHGFSQKEQDRLVEQARFLGPSIFEAIDFSQCQHILEVGCGVGAQTEILLERFPGLTVHGVDASEAQIKTAKKRLSKMIKAGRCQFSVGNALDLKLADDHFDGAFICWFLEHLEKPVEVLKEVHRVMRPGAILYANEVLNTSFYLHPYGQATQQYWFTFNDHQWNMKGDPFVGAKLANYLLKAEFQNVETQILTHHLDNRAPKKRAQFIEYWTKLLLSGAPELIKARRVTPKLVAQMTAELKKIKKDPDAVFIDAWVQAQAVAL